jgi:tRNA(Ile)-lysidine synthase
VAGAGGLSPLAGSVLARVAPRLPETPLAVALSGGADSAVCAWAAAASGRPVRALSVDHGLEHSAALMEAASRVAAHLGLEHEVLTARSGPGEADLRAARYAALEAAAAPGEALVSGHTADDQVETVVGNLLRGSGAAGLAGIPPRRDRWVRPMLDVTREEARTLAGELGLPFADDPANDDPSLRRNRLRHRVLPVLREAAPAADRVILRAAALLAADDRALEERAARVPLRISPGEVRLPAAALAVLPGPIAARAARRALRAALDPYPGGLGDVEGVLGVAAGAAAGASLSGGWQASREGPWVVVHRPGVPPAPPPVRLPVPGSIEFGRHRIEAEALPDAPVPAPLGRFRVALSLDPGAPLVVRAAAPGDRLDIGEGHKPVAEVLREAGIPARLRPGWPVVESGGRMAWVAGARSAAWAARGRWGPVTMLREEST